MRGLEIFVINLNELSLLYYGMIILMPIILMGEYVYHRNRNSRVAFARSGLVSKCRSKKLSKLVDS
jgi:hypothetical protein